MPLRDRRLGANQARPRASFHRLRRAPRSLLCFAWLAALLLEPAAARADVNTPGTRILSSDVIFTGLADFPAYRFVVAAFIPSDPELTDIQKPPPPTEVHDGEPLSTNTVYFQELRAIPLDAPQPVTDAWLASSQTPRSGSFTRHPMRVPIESGERLARARYHVRQIKAGLISIELLSSSTFMTDGPEIIDTKTVPRSYQIERLAAPPGWQFFLMANPAWPREDPTPPVPCAVGDVLLLSPGPRTVVAIQGTPGPDGSIEGKPFVAWGARLHSWMRDEVPVDSAAVASRVLLELEVVREPNPERPMGVTVTELYLDAWGRRFWDREARVDPYEMRDSWQWWWAAGGGAAAAVATGFWMLRRRRRAPG